jgi:hypothetical protein
MLTGMLWYDNDPTTALPAKVQRAAEYYREKYGQNPDLCLVNPRMLPEPLPQAGGITLRASRTILPGHLWIGIQERLPLAAD